MAERTAVYRASFFVGAEIVPGTVRIEAASLADAIGRAKALMDGETVVTDEAEGKTRIYFRASLSGFQIDAPIAATPTRLVY
jgi:hypothetical protein